ncbi:MAG TPA: PaaI family thioesterase [Thermodesulfobacteriota bacterium]|nr:PaaI family thioesterase [Thermodesulfobacteriota bacterium]HOC38844.1 PaaI family thioesterase [Thermodesulfobacteriota bacterium]
MDTLNQEAIRYLFKQDKFANHVGIELVDISPGQATSTLTIQHYHLNGVGTVQGGVLFTLADFTLAAAANTHGNVALVINGDIAFLKPVSSGTLTAHAEEAGSTRRLATYRVSITDDSGDMVAVVQGTAYRKKEKI